MSILLTPLPSASYSPCRPGSSGSSVVLASVGGGIIQPGWYLVSGSMGKVGQAGLAQLREGKASTPLPFDAAGNIPVKVVFRLSSSARQLELDRGVEDALARIELRPIGKFRAMAAMVAQLGLRRLPVVVSRLVSAVIRGNPSIAAREVHEDYNDKLKGNEDNINDLVIDVRTSNWPFVRRRVLMRPAGDIERASDMSSGVWRATGSDPKFIAGRESFGMTLQPGWYRFQMTLEAIAGRVDGPCLYPDYGEGESQGAAVPLGDPHSNGRIDLLVVLRQPVCALRLDPTMCPALFRIHGAALRRMGRFSTFLQMVRHLRGERRQAVMEFIALLVSRGLGDATSELVRRYQARNAHGRSSYSHWVSRFDTLTAMDFELLAGRSARLADGPCISLVVPVYNTPEPWLRKCLDSVLAQVYPRWELCIADDASTSPHVAKTLGEYAARDARIKVVRRPRNGHISAASNSALELATGNYVGLLDHDDELRPHALLEMAETIVANPGAKVLYSDEDKIDEKGRRFDPYFKPDWNPDLLRSQNYLCHFSVLSTDLVREVGGFREGYEGSQDHDLLLRCTERCGLNEVHHVPRILYHWRAVAGSTALHRDAKDYAADAGARAVSDHLRRICADAKIEQLPHGHYRVKWGLGSRPPKVSLIIPTRDRASLLETCVESVLERTDYPDFEVVVVDNGSTERQALDYLADLAASGRAKVLRFDAPFNFSAINNWGVARCEGSIVALLNNDLEVISTDWLREMVGHALRPEVGAVGALLYYPDGRIQHAGVILGVGGIANHAYLGLPRGIPGHGGRAKVAQCLSAVTAACLVVRREVYERVGGLDETFEVAFNDVDFCLRLRAAGYQNVWTPFAELYHHESASRGSEDTPEKAARFRGEVERMEARWGEHLYWDPAYNPNLTLFGTDFGYAFPPRTGRRPVI